MARLLTFVVLIFVTVLVGCGDADQAETAEPRIKPVKIITVTSASMRRDLTFPAVVRAAQTAELTFQLAGQVIELVALEGTEVQAGDVIARLDPRDARSALTQAQAEYENARAEFERAERLAEQDAISRSILESRSTQLAVSRAGLETAQKALTDTTLRAPFAGGVSRLYVERFQNVQAKESIATLQSNQTEAMVDIPGSIIARIPQLTPINTRIVLDAAPDLAIPAVFREASGVADAATQTYQIGFDFVPPEGLLILPGMTATVTTTFEFSNASDIVSNGLQVPIASILAEGEARYVFVVRDDMSLEKRAVSVGQDVSDVVTVTAGLEDGESVVVSGVSFLSAGMIVREWVPE
ncbi:MAG: efflux RND transporter periplasmic adaptor subunit [Pseudomonadota bacterium]